MCERFAVYVLCAASVLVAAHAETFVIEADKTGHDASIKIPVGAVTNLSANFAESLEGCPGSQSEVMRLSGQVSISIAGSEQPIEIKADQLLVELTADSLPVADKRGRSGVAANNVLRSTITAAGADDAQVFVGNVIFDLQTASGPMQIKADKVEHHLRVEAGA